MRKIFQKLLIGIMLVATINLFTRCYGSFELTKTIYEWNGDVTNDKFATSVLTWGLAIFQVYTVSVFIDFAVLNTIEFWTGDNPITMNDDDSDTQVIESNGDYFEITATKNKFQVKKLNCENKNQIDFVYHPEHASWSYSDGINIHTLAQGDIDNNQWITMFYPDGKTETIALK